MPTFSSRSTAEDVVEGLDLGGRVYFVTGADSGIGFETARALASCGATVVIGSLSQERADGAMARIRARHPDAKLSASIFDLGDLAQVKAAAESFPERRLDALVCNAGVYGGKYARTADGFERTFGVCYLGHAALALSLVPLLERSAPSRVVFVSSENHRWPRTLDVAALPIPEKKYSELAAYGLAKRALIVFANEFDARHAPKIRANALHPGDLISTGIDKDSWILRLVMLLNRPFARTPAQAAATSVLLAAHPSLEGVGGRYFAKCREKAPARGTNDPEIRAALWERTLAWMRI